MLGPQGTPVTPQALTTAAYLKYCQCAEVGGWQRTQGSGEHGPCRLALEGVPETQKMLGLKET